MPRSHPLALFYQAGPDFDYLKYQEEKSHFDRLGKSIDISVDRGIRELLFSNEHLARRNIKAVKETGDRIQKSVDESGQAIERSIEVASEKLNSTLTQGFDRLSFDLQDIRDSVDQVAIISEIGFSEIALQLSNLDQSIKHLIEISKSPDQTWAIEQFDIARDAFRRHLYAESLQYIDRAIAGFKGNAGYKLDYRFHLLRGKIRLGNERNYDPAIVSPIEATNDFLAAAKYAEHQERAAFAQAYQLAGWAYYCANRVGESAQAIGRSLEIEEDNAFTRFLLAKVLFNQGDIAEAAQHFARCIRADNQLIIRAGADRDFLNNYEVVRESIELYRQELASAVNQHVQTANFPSLREKLRVVERYSEYSWEQKIDALEEKTRQVESASIEAIREISSDFLLKSTDFTRAIAATKKTISEKIKHVSDIKRESFPEFPDGSFDQSFIGIALLWLGVLVIAWQYSVYLALAWVVLGYYPALIASLIIEAGIRKIKRSKDFRRYQLELAEFEKKQDEKEESRNSEIEVLRGDLASL